MPYGTGSKILDDKIEDCVNALLEDPLFKGRKSKSNPKGDRKLSAILICKSEILNEYKKR